MYASPQTNVLHTAAADSDAIPIFARWLGSWRVSVHRRVLSAPELARSYDRLAPTWSRTLARLGYPGAYEFLLGRLMAAEGVPYRGRAPLRVLDAGTGTGELACALARAAPTSVVIDAVDLSARMLEQAGNRMSRVGLDFTLQQADARRLPYADDTFDVAMTAHLLEHLPDPRVALAEMVRVTRPGGLVVACLTRRSALGFCVHLKWRTHMVTLAQAEAWLGQAGVRDPRCLSADRNGFFRRMSIACAGTKPL
jgi:demethylmenaquinone methyltransferase/2-methoxy-6-polyprenyl-1,4-benzoquinol methylase